MEDRSSFPGIWQAIPFLILLLFLLLICGSLAETSLGVLGLEPNSLATLAIGNIMAFALVIPFALLFTRRPLRETLPFRAVSPEIWAPISLVVIGWNIVASELDNLLRYVLPIPDWFEEDLRELISADQNHYLQFLVLVVIAPWTEELFFRGIIFQGFRRRYSLFTAAWVSALLFGLFHANPWQFPSAFVMGGILAGWCARTGSLWPALFAHALNNGLPLLIVPLGLEIPGYTVSETGTTFQPIWFDALGILLFVVGLIWVARKLPGGKPSEWSAGWEPVQ